jgi:hypothetical protein
MDDLVDDLLYGGVDGTPLIGQECVVAVHDLVGEFFEPVVGILSEPEKGLPRKLDAEGFQFEGPVFHGHFEVFRIEDIMVAADEVEGGVELAIVEAVVTLEAEVQADDVGVRAAGVETGERIEFGDGMAHADAIEFPGDGIAGTGPGLKMLVVLHAVVRYEIMLIGSSRAEPRDDGSEAGGGARGRGARLVAGQGAIADFNAIFPNGVNRKGIVDICQRIFIEHDEIGFLAFFQAALVCFDAEQPGTIQSGDLNCLQWSEAGTDHECHFHVFRESLSADGAGAGIGTQRDEHSCPIKSQQIFERYRQGHFFLWGNGTFRTHSMNWRRGGCTGGGGYRWVRVWWRERDCASG